MPHPTANARANVCRLFGVARPADLIGRTFRAESVRGEVIGGTITKADTERLWYRGPDGRGGRSLHWRAIGTWSIQPDTLPEIRS